MGAALAGKPPAPLGDTLWQARGHQHPAKRLPGTASRAMQLSSQHAARSVSSPQQERMKLSPALAGSSTAHMAAPVPAAATLAPGAAGCSVPAALTTQSRGTLTLLPGHRAVPVLLCPTLVPIGTY